MGSSAFLRLPVEHPTAFPNALKQPCFGEQFQMSGHPGLALSQYSNELTDRQLTMGTQRQQTQPGRLRRRTKGAQQGFDGLHNVALSAPISGFKRLKIEFKCY